MMNHLEHDVEATPTVQTASVAPTALPEHEPAALPLAERREDLLAQIEELEGMLQYMGNLHPRREEMRQRLSGLRSLLERWDQAITVQQGRDSIRRAQEG